MSLLDFLFEDDKSESIPFTLTEDNIIENKEINKLLGDIFSIYHDKRNDEAFLEFKVNMLCKIIPDCDSNFTCSRDAFYTLIDCLKTCVDNKLSPLNDEVLIKFNHDDEIFECIILPKGYQKIYVTNEKSNGMRYVFHLRQNDNQNEEPQKDVIHDQLNEEFLECRIYRSDKKAPVSAFAFADDIKRYAYAHGSDVKKQCEIAFIRAIQLAFDIKGKYIDITSFSKEIENEKQLKKQKKDLDITASLIEKVFNLKNKDELCDFIGHELETIDSLDKHNQHEIYDAIRIKLKDLL